MSKISERDDPYWDEFWRKWDINHSHWFANALKDQPYVIPIHTRMFKNLTVTCEKTTEHLWSIEYHRWQCALMDREEQRLRRVLAHAPDAQEETLDADGPRTLGGRYSVSHSVLRRLHRRHGAANTPALERVFAVVNRWFRPRRCRPGGTGVPVRAP